MIPSCRKCANIAWNIPSSLRAISRQSVPTFAQFRPHPATSSFASLPDDWCQRRPPLYVADRAENEAWRRRSRPSRPCPMCRWRTGVRITRGICRRWKAPCTVGTKPSPCAPIGPSATVETISLWPSYFKTLLNTISVLFLLSPSVRSRFLQPRKRHCGKSDDVQ